jgi:non-ribosomal peptide synthetase component E (peptide arylation enzyme)
VRPSVDQPRAALLAEHPTWRPRALDQALREAALRYPERPLVLTDERALSYHGCTVPRVALRAVRDGLPGQPGPERG